MMLMPLPLVFRQSAAWFAVPMLLTALFMAQAQQPPIGVPVPPLGAGPFVLDTAEQHKIRVTVVTKGVAQEPGSLRGKILRVRDDGSVPPDNPFVGRAGYRPEIYTLGHRNSLGHDQATFKSSSTGRHP